MNRMFDDLFLGFGMLTSFFVMLIYFVFFAPPFVYLVLRWRASRGQLPDDPHLTLRVVLGMFITMATLVLLIGVSMMVLMIALGEDIEAPVWALVVSGGLMLVAYAFVGRFLPPSSSRAVARAYGNLRLLLFGIVAMVAFVAFFVVLFEGDLGEDQGKAALALLVVWMPAEVLQLMLMVQAAEPFATPPAEL